MKSARNLIAATAKFSPGMKYGVSSLCSCPAGLAMQSYRYSSTIIFYTYTAVSKYFYFYVFTMTSQCLINGVVYYFPN